MLTAALACDGVAPAVPAPTAVQTPTRERQSACPSFPCTLTGTVNAASEVDHFVKLVRDGQLNVRLVPATGTTVVYMYLWFCQPVDRCSTSYEGMPNPLQLSMAANKLQVGDGLVITIFNAGPSVPYTLEIDWEG
jgi:hypothetical protein